jgi:hypothetical protein
MFVRPHFAGIVMRNGFRMREERKVVAVQLIISNRSAGPMARRLTTNQEIAGSIPASINMIYLLLFTRNLLGQSCLEPLLLHRVVFDL